ncbi:MAG TPA: NADP-dependent oxidoreductase [Chthoniobacterales bacterium]|nr:NADP-dependent oxidoreductase [Chthoniobacterales bacterium]
MKSKFFVGFVFLAINGALNFVSAQANPAMMKAIVAHQFGGPEVLKYEDAPRPQPKENEVLVRVIAAGVNPVDTYVRSGNFGTRSLPVIPGRDIAGIVEETGPGATQFKKGDAVYGNVNNGGYAEYAVAAEKNIALKPVSLDFIQAAAVPVAARTAWNALIETAHLGAGQTVLIQGGSGGVGSFAIQIAKVGGAKVYATASTANQDLLKQLGADVAIDYTKQKFEDVVKDADVVLEAANKDTLDRDYAVVKKGGVLVSIVGPTDAAKALQYGVQAPPLAAAGWSSLPELTKLFDAKKLKVVVTQTLPLSEARQAQEQVGTHHTRGKIVLKVADEKK